MAGDAVRTVAKHFYDPAGGVIAQLEFGPGTNPAAVAAGKAAVRVAVQLDMTHRESASERLDDKNKVKVRESIDSSATRSASGGDPSVGAGGGSGGEPVEESEQTAGLGSEIVEASRAIVDLEDAVTAAAVEVVVVALAGDLHPPLPVCVCVCVPPSLPDNSNTPPYINTNLPHALPLHNTDQ